MRIPFMSSTCSGLPPPFSLLPGEWRPVLEAGVVGADVDGPGVEGTGASGSGEIRSGVCEGSVIKAGV